MPEDFVGLSEAAELANCSRDTIRRAAQRGELEARMGSGPRGPQWWIDRAGLSAWNQRREGVVVVESSPEPQTRPTVDAQVHQAVVNDLVERLRRAEERIVSLQLQASQSQQLLEERARSLQQKEAEERHTAALAEQLKLARRELGEWEERRRSPWWNRWAPRLFG